jgi:hypothetical protein
MIRRKLAAARGFADIRYKLFRRENEQYFSWKLLASAARMRRYAGAHAGERCFIIGNGPSLNDTDLTLLRGERTFGLNRIYLLFPKLGFSTTYFVCVNPLVIQQCASDIAALQMPKFIGWAGRSALKLDRRTMFVRPCLDKEIGFSLEPTRCMYEGATVTYVALQLAYYMGFKRVILIGVDHNFVTTGEPHKEVVSAGDDPNHFSPQYFGKGFRWQLPDLDTSARAYEAAREAFAEDGREVLDATVGGKLEVFPKVRYEDLFLNSPVG